MVVVVVGDQAESERVGPSEIIRHICKRGIVRFFLVPLVIYPYCPPTLRFPYFVIRL